MRTSQGENKPMKRPQRAQDNLVILEVKHRQTSRGENERVKRKTNGQDNVVIVEDIFHCVLH